MEWVFSCILLIYEKKKILCVFMSVFVNTLNIFMNTFSIFVHHSNMYTCTLVSVFMNTMSIVMHSNCFIFKLKNKLSIFMLLTCTIDHQINTIHTNIRNLIKCIHNLDLEPLESWIIAQILYYIFNQYFFFRFVYNIEWHIHILYQFKWISHFHTSSIY